MGYGTRVALAGFVATALAIGIGRFAFTPLFPMMQADAGLSLAAGSWLASANYAGYLVGALMPLAMRMPSAQSIRAALVLIASATLAMGLVDEFAAWLLLRFIAGVACAWIMIFAFAWSLERLAPIGSPLLSALVFGGVGAGIAATGALCIVFMQAGISSALGWRLLGFATAVMIAVVWTTIAPEPGDALPARKAGPTWKREWNWLVFCFGASGFGYIVPATYLPVMAKAIVTDPLVFGLSWPIFGIAVLASTLLAAPLSARIGLLQLWLGSQGVMAAGVLLPQFWPGIGGIVASAVCVGGTFMVVTLVAMQEARKATTPAPERLMAAMTAAFACGQIAGPICVSLVAGDGGGFFVVPAAAALLLAASMVVLYGRFSGKAGPGVL